MANSREYIASMEIYKTDILKIRQAQLKIKDFADKLATYEVLNAAFAFLSDAALGAFSKISKGASLIAAGMSNVFDVKLSLPSEREAVVYLVGQGNDALTGIETYFDIHPSFEAIRTNLPYWEEMDENVRFVTGGGVITSILIGNVWYDN